MINPQAPSDDRRRSPGTKGEHGVLGAVRTYISRMDDSLAEDWSPRYGLGIAMGAAVFLAGWWAMVPFLCLAVVKLRLLKDFIFWTAWVVLLISPGYYRPSIGFALFLAAYFLIARLAQGITRPRRSNRPWLSR
jgi:hypothetical protein